MPAVGDGPLQDGWLGPLDGAIYPPVGSRQDPSLAPGCPPFWRDSVVDRPDGDPVRSDTVAPGLYRFADDAGAGQAKVLPFHGNTTVPRPSAVHPEQGNVVDVSTVRHCSPSTLSPVQGSKDDSKPTAPQPPVPGYSVVWWDPNSPTLRLGVKARFGIRQAELLSKDTPASVVEQDLARYRTWRKRRDDTMSEAATPSLRVLTVTELTERLVADRVSAATDVDEPEVVELASNPDRPSGRRFGALVHAVLAATPLDATADQVGEFAGLEGRMLGATDAEVTAAGVVATATLAHPILERARRAVGVGACRRESPVTMQTDDGTLIEGLIDLAFRDDETWVVVDFKTDRELAVALDIYRRQVQLYVEMVARATGEPARAVLMRI